MKEEKEKLTVKDILLLIVLVPVAAIALAVYTPPQAGTLGYYMEKTPSKAAAIMRKAWNKIKRKVKP